MTIMTISVLTFVSMNQYFRIGKFSASHGLTGELILVHSLGKKTTFKDLEAIFMESGKDNFLPHFIENATVKNEEETYIKLEGVNTKESARRFTPKDVWLQEEDFKKFASKSAPITLLGYQMINVKEPVGEIIEVTEQPHQVLCTIMYKGNEALIPVHPDNLIKTDHKNKKVYVELPEGLLEIYE